MGRTYQEDPLKVWNFVVEVDGFARAGFTECLGMERTTEVATYREGGQNSTEQKSAGQTTYANITLKRGQIISTLPGEDDFYDWASDVHSVTGNGVAAQYRRDFDIVQFDAAGVEVKRWNVVNAFPMRFKPMGDGNAMEKQGNSIEELELAHEGFDKV